MAKEAISAVFPSRSLPRHRALCLATGFLRQPLRPCHAAADRENLRAVSGRTETREFDARVRELLDLVIHSLYSKKEVFLRELISNASDALDKLRFQALTRPELLEGGQELAIVLELDQAARTLSVVDTGIGMTRAELIENLGTIAGSGTRRFLEELGEKGAERAPELIGQFGVGFYASFMVADEVVVVSRKAGEKEGHVWRSEADGRYVLEQAPAVARGTRVTLLLKDQAEGEPDFLDAATLKELVRRTSDFVEYPIRLGDETINSQKPLWARPKDEITPEKQRELYHHLTHDWRPPLETIHLRAEGATEFTALLFVPCARGADLFEQGPGRSRLSLYVKRVLITNECEELLPPWLRFVRGVVEASDLPLNVSRETLQANPQVRQIERRLTKKVLATLGRALAERRSDYAVFWGAFGPVLKEGVCVGADSEARISKLLLFASSHGEEPTTLAEYVERAPPGQEAIWYMTGAERRTLDAAPQLEAARARGWEVLYLLDPIDEWLIDSLTEFDGKPLRSVHAADAELADEEHKQRAAAAAQEHAALLEALGQHLAAQVAAVRFSARPVASPALLVYEQGSPRPNMRRFLREARQIDLPASKPVLELACEHPLVARLCELHAADPADPRVRDHGELLLGQALLAEGSPLSDPVRFARLVSDLMSAAARA